MESEFNWRRRERNQRDTYCRPCRSAYKAEHYAANKTRYISQAMERRRSLRFERNQFIVEYLRAHPCMDCGEGDPVVLDFDHVRGEKLFSVSMGLTDRSFDSLVAEMAKCEVVCTNCHRRRTAHRAGFARAAVAQWQSHALPRR